MNAASDNFCTRDGVRIHLLRWGNAAQRRLVLLHGGGANAHWWDHLAPRFGAAWHVVAVDLRGHGDSDRPAELESGDMERDLAAVVERECVGSSDDIAAPVVVGHSMGAAVATRYAAEGGALRALVLLDPARGGDKRSGRRMRLALTLGRGYVTREDAIERYRFVPDSAYASETLRRNIAAHSVRRDDDGRYRYKFDPRWFGIPARARPDLTRLKCPVLVLRGSESEVLTREGLAAWQQELPHAECAEIARAGHHLQLDRPDETASAIEAFLARLR